MAGLFCAALAVLIGLPILRLRGVYFAMVTLVLTEVARLAALALTITNGAKGIVSIPLPQELSLFGLTLAPDFATLANPRRAFYLVSVALAAIVFAGLYRLVHSRLGHLCQSLRQNEELAASIGVNVTYLRVLAYAISSFLGGIGGAMFVAISQSIYPSSFTVTDSINFMLSCFLGGLGYVSLARSSAPSSSISAGISSSASASTSSSSTRACSSPSCWPCRTASSRSAGGATCGDRGHSRGRWRHQALRWAHRRQ